MFDILGTRLALWAIRLYQRHLSPIKGYACPYSLVHGGTGCSGYGYRVIRDRGLVRGLALLERRLGRCTEARRSIMPVARNPVLGYQRGECDPGCDCDLPAGRSCIPDLCDVLGNCCDIPDCKRRRQPRESLLERWRRWRWERRRRQR